MSGKEEETAGPSGKEPKMSSHAPSEKGAIGGHAVKTETTSAPPQGETGAVINELISAMTQVFKQSSDKPSPGDSISRNVAQFSPNTTKPRYLCEKLAAIYKCHLAYHCKCKSLLGLLHY